MNILYSSNDKYVPILTVSLISLLENNKSAKEITLFVIDCGIQTSSKQMLNSIVEKYKRTINFILLDNLIDDEILNVPNKSYYGRFFGNHITSDDRLLYLDCDVIIDGSIEKLYSADMANNWIAGVQGPGASYECRRKINFPDEYRYINTGVLLINLKEWRINGVEEKLVNYLNLHGEIPPYHDQNIINAVCYKHTLILEPQYNLVWSMICCKPKHICKLNNILHYYTEDEIKRAIKFPIIIHFSNSIYGRPWNDGCKHPCKKIFQKYLKLSPWKELSIPQKHKSLIRRFRDMIYRNVPSYLYYKLHVIEKFIICHIIPVIPSMKLKVFVSSYMNGD